MEGRMNEKMEEGGTERTMEGEMEVRSRGRQQALTNTRTVGEG